MADRNLTEPLQNEDAATIRGIAIDDTATSGDKGWSVTKLLGYFAKNVGDATSKFKVKAGTASDDAVNKGQLDKVDWKQPILSRKDVGSANKIILNRNDGGTETANIVEGATVGFTLKEDITGAATLKLGSTKKPFKTKAGRNFTANMANAGDFVIAKVVGNEFLLENIVRESVVRSLYGDARDVTVTWVNADGSTTTKTRPNFAKMIFQASNSTGWKNALDYGEGLSGLNQALQENQNLYIPAGEYTVDTVFDVVHGSRHIRGDGATITISHPLEFDGEITDLTTLSQAAVKRTDKITLSSTTGILAGDILVIHDHNRIWSGFRSYYNAGEFVEVRDIVGNDVYLNGALYDDYNSGTAIAKLGNNSFKMSGVKFVSANIPHTVKIHKMNGVKIDGVKMFGNHGNATLSISKSYGILIRDSRISTIGASSNDYGIVIGNSQNIHILNTHAHGRRHGVTTGGNSDMYNVPVRELVWDGGKVSNDPGSNVPAYDYHGNIENARCVNATIVGGVTTAGKDISYTNNTISAIAGSIGVVSYGGEILGGVFEFRDNLMFSDVSPDNIGRGYIDFGGNSDPINQHTMYDVDIIIKDNVLRVKSDISTDNQYIIAVRASGFTGNVNVDVDHNKVFGFQGKTFQLLRLIATQADGNAGKSKGIVADHIITDADSCWVATFKDGSDGSTFRNAPCRFMRNSGTVTLHTTTDSSTVSEDVPLKFKYPKLPGVLLGNNHAGYVGNRIGVPNARAWNDRVRVAVSTDDATDFSSADDIVVAYETVIAEC